MGKHNTTIFVVEDDQFYREIIIDEIQKDNSAKVFSFSQGRECISNLHLNPDIIIMDYFLEGTLNGEETLRIIKKYNNEVKIIMLTSNEKLNDAVKTLRNGAIDYLIKDDRAFVKLARLLKRPQFLNKNKKKEKTIFYLD